MSSESIAVDSNGYSVRRGTEVVIEGIKDFSTACELHEMILGERLEEEEDIKDEEGERSWVRS